MKFTLRRLNATAQLGVLASGQDTFRQVFESQMEARAILAATWEDYGVVEPTFYGTGHHWMAYPQQFADPFVVLGYAASRWPEAHLNSNFIQLPLFSALDVAEKVSSIIGFAEHGLSLVVGLGWRPEEFAAAGTDVKYRVSRFEESLEVCERLWAGEELDHHGKHWTVQGRLGTPLANREDLTLIVGAQSPPAARRAARFGDGLHVSWVMNHVGNSAANRAYGEELAALGKTSRYWAMAKFISVDADETKARERLSRMATMFDWYGGSSTWVPKDVKTKIAPEDEAAERTIAGTPEQVVEQLLVFAREFPYTDGILTWLAPGNDEKENLEHFAMLAEKVVVPLARELGGAPGQTVLRV
jgi:alkanesulfonate monooxygenase SsuD/methylene tetrahydromethanopterin reductase-like flavin-dependent oxidoreductase (luciferase family)